jgi:hypothetical protein
VLNWRLVEIGGRRATSRLDADSSKLITGFEVA